MLQGVQVEGNIYREPELLYREPMSLDIQKGITISAFHTKQDKCQIFLVCNPVYNVYFLF